MPSLLTHPGTQYSYALAAQLHLLGLLNHFVTGLARGSDASGNAVGGGWSARLAARLLGGRRAVPGVPGQQIWLIPEPELWALARLQWAGKDSEAIFFRRNAAFQRRVPEALIRQADAVIGFDTSSWILIDRAHAAGKPFVLDASIAHPRAKEEIYARLRRDFPEWAEQSAPKDPALLALEEQEIARADRIVAATSFTRQTLITHGADPAKIVVNPYGTDLAYFTSKWTLRPEDPLAVHSPTEPTTHNPQLTTHNPQPTTFLFLGKISARKGIPWLCRVWARLRERHPQARLIIAGNGHFPAGYRLPEGIEVRGFVAPEDRAALMHAADVFVFPSYFEGFGQVIIEAMACGLPVITTPNTVGPELITPGREGFLAEPGDDEALLAAMAHFAGNPGTIRPMGLAARERVGSMTWAAYGERWREILGQFENLKIWKWGTGEGQHLPPGVSCRGVKEQQIFDV